MICTGDKLYVSEVLGPALTTSSNIEEAEFPDLLKMADIKPIYKKISRNEKGNYRLVSVLPNLSKVYEEFYLKKFHHFLKIFSLDTNAVSERVLALYIAY